MAKQETTASAVVSEGVYEPGRFVVSWVGAKGARDPFMLTSQVKVMREGFERLGHKPALMLIVVADPELEAAVEIVSKALDTTTALRSSPKPGSPSREGGKAT
jgi:hypothetical protein